MNKILLLIGCTGTLGTYFVKKYSKVYTIIGVARNKPQHKVGSIDFFEADVCEDADKIAAYALDKYGKIDVLVNNAVFYDLVDLKNKKLLAFEQELKTNLIAPLELANKILNRFWMPEGCEKNTLVLRNIINISSISGINVYENKKQATYSATKAALNMLTRHMASEYAVYGIRANAVAPGRLSSAILDRTCSAIDELAKSNINGKIIVIDEVKQFNPVLSDCGKVLFDK